MSATLENKEAVASLITRLGRPSAVVLLDSHYHFFSLPYKEGFIGYRMESYCAVAMSDPVCADEDCAELTYAFHDFCKSKGWRVIHIMVSESFRDWAMGKICHTSIQGGEEFIVDPSNELLKGGKNVKLRAKVHKALHEGVTINEYKENDNSLQNEIRAAASRWIETRRGPQIFLADLDVFSICCGKRWFYAKKDDLVVGLLILNRLEKYNGWVLNVLLTTPEAPSGTSEGLMVSVIEKLREEKCHFFSLGAGSGGTLGKIVGLNPFSAFLARICLRFADWFFHLRERKNFLNKFHPKTPPFYILFENSRIGPRELMALKKALNVRL